jgi:hypothetical protein
MSFDGSEFIALDDDAVAADEPLDTFVDHALRSNVLALSALGYCATWHRHTDDEDDQDQKANIRPYASVEWSSVLAVPWIVDAGQDALTTNTFYRSGQEEGGVETSPFRVVLEGVAEDALALSSTTTPAWQVDERTLSFPTQTRRQITRLRIEQKSVVGANNGNTSIDHLTRVGGAIIFNESSNTTVFDSDSGVIPNTSYRGVYCCRFSDADEYYDILSSIGSLGYTRPLTTVTSRENTSTTRASLSYVQVRSIQCVNEYDGTWLEGPEGNYDPARVVTGPDALRHTLQLQRLMTRPRPLAIGPNGTERSGESAYPTGIGGVFSRVTASTSWQTLDTFTALPATAGPRIRLLAYLCCTYGAIDDALDPYQADNQGLAGFDFRLEAFRWKSGSTASLATAEVSQAFVAYPRYIGPYSAFLHSEHLWHELPGGAWPYKEGQLFPEDHQLMVLLDLEVDLAGQGGPASNSQPIAFHLEARQDTSVGTDIPPPPDETTWQGSASDISLTLTGYSAWEVPQ